MSREKIIKYFGKLETARDVANLFKVRYPRFIYHLYRVPLSKQYFSFDIPKRNGGTRSISAPLGFLKDLQRRLNKLLQMSILPKACAHAFWPGKSILTNAQIHVGAKHILNVDLEDFFGTINFGRVRGLFMADPFSFGAPAASVLAHLCCLNGTLPQGAPTSPIISNLISLKMDNDFKRTSHANEVYYTRYADDLTFSFRGSEVISKFVISNKTNQLLPGINLRKIISENGFTINKAKLHLRSQNQCQEVAGLVVNKKVNIKRRFVRQVRAMLHAWREYGYESAQKEYYAKYCKKVFAPNKRLPSFKRIVEGKINYIGMVRGYSDDLYLKFCTQIQELDPKIRLKKIDPALLQIPLIITEGASDWKHLKAAFRNLKGRGFFKELNVQFSEFEGSVGSESIVSKISSLHLVKQPRITIFIVDSDKPDIIEKVNDIETKYSTPRYWGNNVYSFALPQPDTRLNDLQQNKYDAFIELYYTDKEIIKSHYDKRLFLSSEFDEKTRQHRTNSLVQLKQGRRIDFRRASVVDAYSIEDGFKYALTKNQFAKLVLNAQDEFADIEFESFKKVFFIIEQIISSSKSV